MHFAIATIEDPLQNATVFAIAWPQVSAIFILTKPVHIEDSRQLGCFRLLPDFQPVRKVVSHVISAKREHGHGIAAKLSYLSGGSGGRLTAGGCAQERTMLPVEGLRDQRNHSCPPTTE